jgi:pimeloyl-ACP methyl ester carboxylesterase
LLITGEPGLDHVVPPHHTLGYTRLVPHAETLTFERTGHIGVVTLPVQFAATVAAFVERAERGAVPAAEQSRKAAG